ncbi:hypothetical protein FD754_006709 [Muntiacus muntjak]|uniref:40S ribosomal protein S7 n=1 Tax=Muntiacus muntjak TaxID=9888 RepID=A0A5N3WM64_MUNMU|nr:hypothetical protein FD754_006709 [Muntiacus muntjak]
MSGRIVEPSGEKPPEFEAQLQKLNIMAAKEIEVVGGQKAIIIFVLLVCELEKKFSGKHVVFMTQTRILPKQTRKSCMKNEQKLPRSCTLVAVHDTILEDLVFPSETVGKKIRMKPDGRQLVKHSRTVWNPRFNVFWCL